MGDTIRLVSPDGTRVIEVPVEQAAGAIDQGFHAETGAERTQRVSDIAKEETYGGVSGKIATGVTSALGTATLGATDALIAELGGGEDLTAYREVNPGAHVAGSLVGAAAPFLPGVASVAKYLPGGLASRAASEIAGLGEGAGLAARVGYTGAGTAVEGGLQSAGSYVSDVALGDKELSAEGFAGAVGHGALWAGGAGAGLTLAAGGLMAARRLFPKVEMTAENVAKVERQAADEIGRAVEDGHTLETAARERIGEIATERAFRDPKFAEEMASIKARTDAARLETATYRAEAAEVKAAKAKEQLEAAKAPRKTRRAMGEEEAAAPGAPAPEAGGVVPEASSTSAATQEPTTWREFTRGKMGEYMKSEGGHAGAMKRLGEEWRALKAGGQAPADAITSLEQQLRGTKQALDAGQALSQIGESARAARTASTIEEQVARAVAKVDPEAAKLVAAVDEMNASRSVVDEWLGKYGGKQSAVSKFERSEGARAWADKVRPKQSGYYEAVPEGEGNVALARGREYKFRGSEEERAAADARINAKVQPEERAAIDEMFARRRAGKIADEVTGEVPVSVEDKVADAIKAKVPDVHADIADTAPALSRYEAASADITETLGPRAPVSAQERAQALRTAQATSEDHVARAAANAAEDIDKATALVSLPTATALPGKGTSALGALQGAGDVWQALHMMGVPLPDPKDIPAVGPLLSMYLKARVLGKAFGRFGGKVAQTAETTIASKAAQTKQRIYQAVDKLLDTSSKAVSRATPKVGGVAAILGTQLFDARAAGKAPPPKAKSTDLAALYHARADELTAAMQPGAVRAAVRDKVRTTNPEILDAIVAAKERKLAYLHETMPKADQPPGLLTGATEWTPNKPALASWTRRIAAAEDPASVLETAASGGLVSMEAAETLKQVYPRLYQEAQMRLLDKVTDGTARTLPYARRLQLSMLFGLPLDGSQQPEMAAFLQQSYKGAPGSANPSAMAPPMQPPTPSLSADVRSASRTDPSARTTRP